jgi:hypothetical protein
MEFYELVDARLDEQALQAIGIGQLADYCASIERVLQDQGDSGRVSCVWGEFSVRRELIRGGVRFTLPGCPNNLAWTLTIGGEPEPDHVVVHVTMSPQHHDLEFIDTIHTFVADWKQGLVAESG